MMRSCYHQSILETEILEFCKKIPQLQVQNRCVYGLDATLGDAGHTLKILQSFPGIRIIACDLDAAMLARSETRLQQNLPEGSVAMHKNLDILQNLASFSENHPQRCHLFHSDFATFVKTLSQANWLFSLIIFDLGVASFHFDDAERGFSFQDQTLDMRLNPENSQQTAASWLNTCSEKELQQVLSVYGEQRYAKSIARFLQQNRPFVSARQLSEHIAKGISFLDRRYKKHDKKNKKKKSAIHPATKVLQAIRIHINQELHQLEHSLSITPKLLEKNGLLFYISFHSLEDRQVKLCFRAAKKAGFHHALTPKPIRPQSEEIQENRRSRSACLRILQRHT